MSIEHLSFFLIERVALIVAVASLILFSLPFGKSGSYGLTRREKIFLACFFGIMGVVGTYAGGKVSESIANFRALGVVTAGLVGGPFLGGTAGLIAGIHRWAIDPFGFSALPCALATVAEGLAAGLFYGRQRVSPDWRLAGAIAFVGESFHMLLVLMLSRPFEAAVELVRIITVPMVVSNAFGAALFAFAIYKIGESREKDQTNQAELLLRIAKNTVSHLRQGLNFESAHKTAEIIHNNLPVAGVSITDRRQILSHVGEGDDHHKAGGELQTQFTKAALKQGVPKLGLSRSVISCKQRNCPLTSAAVVPLRKKNEVIGTLKLYGSGQRPLTASLFEITKGLGELFSTQLELEEIAEKEKMIAEAEIARLQAQIQPHFLFNALNTIASFARTKPEKARQIIQDLALYMRKNLDARDGFIPLKEEVAQVRAYVSIEQARFGDRIQYVETIDETLLSMPIPQLIIEPLVENAVRHGLKAMPRGGIVELSIQKESKGMRVCVNDNGAGIPSKIIDTPGTVTPPSPGNIGLKNCHDRLLNLYGETAGLVFDTEPGKGTKISFFIPETP